MFRTSLFRIEVVANEINKVVIVHEVHGVKSLFALVTLDRSGRQEVIGSDVKVPVLYGEHLQSLP